MENKLMRPVLIAALALLLPVATAVLPATAEESESEEKNQIVVFGGASILDASQSDSRIFRPDFPGFPGFPGFRPGGFPEVELRTRTGIGNSAVFGARYSRYLKDRLAVEADLSVGPGHDITADGELCLEGRCFGGGDLDLPGFRPPEGGFTSRGGRRVTAWQYGAGLAYDIVGGDVRPVIVFGAGGATWSGSGRTETDFELRFGAGLKILFGRLGARVDVIDHLVLDHFLSGKSEHNIHVTAGFLVGF
jgi:hypothetical protein